MPGKLGFCRVGREIEFGSLSLDLAGLIHVF